MRSVILAGCLWMISNISYSQNNGRLRPGTPVKFETNGTVSVKEGDLARNYGVPDTSRQKTLHTETALGGNPNATRFKTVQAQCDQKSVQFNWVAVQQSNAADKYEIEQSSDNGRTWNTIGVSPAQRSDNDESSYNFQYNKILSGVVFRITAVNHAGERIHSPILQAPCSNTTTLSVTPNPVYTSTMIRIGSPAATYVRLVLVNQSGLVVQNRQAALNPGINNVSLDMTGLQKGFYNLSIVWEQGNQNALKLIKQ